MEAYCMKCKGKQTMSNPQEITMKNGRPATQGICPDCGSKMFKIGKASKFKFVYFIQNIKNEIAKKTIVFFAVLFKTGCEI